MKELLIYVDGAWREARDGKRFPVYSPADGEVIGTAPLAGAEDVEIAARAAEAAQKAWGRTNAFYRGNLLRKAAAAVEARAEEIAAVMTAEQGKTLDEAMQETRKGAAILRYYAEEGERVCGRIIPNEAKGCVSGVIYQPVGPAVAITPWNYPIELLAWKVGGALAAGCTIVCKIPYETPLSPTLFAECVIGAGLPENVLQTITGRGSEIGTPLVCDPRFKRVAFTGSTKVGKALGEACMSQLKHLSLELGGSLPMIVFSDCDIDKAVEGCVRRSFRNNGQICIAINRVYVQEEIYDRFMERLVQRVNKLTIGDTRTENVDLGPMCTAAGLEKVAAHVEDARQRGAIVATGGRRPEGEKFRAGNYYEPTVLSRVTREMRVMREESFGPVIGVMPFSDVEDAIEKANDTEYGLAAICYTSNLNTAKRIAVGVEAGNIAINNVDAGVLNAPYGGWKESGVGCEHGTEGLYEYLRAKHVRIRFDE